MISEAHLERMDRMVKALWGRLDDLDLLELLGQWVFGDDYLSCKVGNYGGQDYWLYTKTASYWFTKGHGVNGEALADFRRIGYAMSLPKLEAASQWGNRRQDSGL